MDYKETRAERVMNALTDVPQLSAQIMVAVNKESPVRYCIIEILSTLYKLSRDNLIERDDPYGTPTFRRNQSKEVNRCQTQQETQ